MVEVLIHSLTLRFSSNITSDTKFQVKIILMSHFLNPEEKSRM